MNRDLILRQVFSLAMMLLHSGTFHQESWFPNCSNLVAWLRSDQVMLKAGTWWYQMPRCVSWWRRTSWPWKAPDQGTWTSMQNEDKQTMNNDRRGDAWKFMEILKVCVSICFSKRIFGFLDMLGIWVVPPCWHTPYWGIRQFYVAIEKEAFDGH